MLAGRATKQASKLGENAQSPEEPKVYILETNSDTKLKVQTYTLDQYW